MQEQTSNYRWLILVLMFVMNAMSFCSINCIPPLFLEITEQIPMTKAEMGSIMGLVLLSSLFFAPIGGGISDKIGSRWAAGAGILLAAVAGGLRAYVDSTTGLMLCMFFIGAGIAFFAPNMPKVIGAWFPRHQLALANGICTSGLGIGGAIGMGISAGFLSPTFGGWRGAVLAVSVCVFCLGTLWLLLYREREAKTTAPQQDRSMFKNFKKVLKVRDLNLILLYRGLNMAGFMALITFLPVSLQERGIEGAGQLVSIMMGVNVIFNVLGGMLSDKAGKRKPFLMVSTLVLGLTILTFPLFAGVPLVIALIIAGVCCGTLAPLPFILPVEFEEIGTALAGTAVGLMLMLGNTCGFFGPIISGKLIDATGSNWAGFVFIAAACMSAAVLIIPLRETGRKKKQAQQSDASVR